MSKYTKPALREKIKNRIMASSKGGKPGQWSARKSQLLVKEYEKAGGSYKGGKSKKQKALTKWTGEDWGTKSGKNSTQGKDATGERYLPKKTREKLTKKEYEATSRKKRADMKKGKQHSKQPKKVAKKTSRAKSKAKFE